MSQPANRRLEAERIQDIALEYEQRGYRVLVEPRGDEIPPPLRGFAPDIVAIGRDETVVIEIKSGDTVQPDLSKLAAAVAKQPGWRLDFIAEPVPEAPVSESTVTRLADSARELWDQGYLEPAILTVWAALEGAMLLVGERQAVQLVGAPSSMLSEAYALGLLSDRQHDLLRRSLDARNRIVHGGTADNVESVRLKELASLAGWLAGSAFVSVGQMVDWFLEHYTDPADGVPYNSGEGGYQYIHGGPYHALEELSAQFPNAPLEALEEAADIIEDLSFEWVKRGQY